MIFTPLPLAGAYAISMEPREDKRGFFARMFCAHEMRAQGLPETWPQMNASMTRQAGAVRGLHFQRPPEADAKIVRCIAGSVFDVLVDLRQGSPSFGRWTALELSATNRRMVFIPAGFAHGFQSLEPDCELIYLHSTPYNPSHEGGVHHRDPAIGVEWPLPTATLSPRDQALPVLSAIAPMHV